MKKSTALTSVVLATVLLLAGTACMKEESSSVSYDEVAAATDYTQVVSKAARIVRAPLREKIEGSGIIQGVEEAVVKTQTSGVVESIGFELGAPVERGQVLMVLDDTVASLSESQVRKQYENSRKDLMAKEQLYERGAISLVQLESARAAAEGLEAQLRQSADALGYANVTSPISGNVAQRDADLVVGTFVEAGRQVARIVDLDRLRIRLGVGQSQLFQVHEGARAVVTIEALSETIEAEGSVVAIGAASDPTTGSWTVLVDFPNPRPEMIRAGISAKVTIFDDHAPLHLLVPNSAMVYRDGETYIYVVEGENARQVAVEVADQYGDLTAVESLDPSVSLEGKQVLVSLLSRIVDGDPVVTE
jgi:membrane fusion protein (multidrug efflux system)